jgi:sec-independent protein translocase protein TatB
MFPTEGRGLEFLIIAALALVVVGPKELPGLLRKLGQFVGKMRNIANDFRTSFDEMARQSELDDLRKQVEEMRAQTASIGSDPTGIGQAMQDFQMTSMNPAPDYGAPPPEAQPEPVADKPKRAPRKKPSAKGPAVKATAAPAKRRAPAKPKAAASKDTVQ